MRPSAHLYARSRDLADLSDFHTGDHEELAARLENLRRVQHELMVADAQGLDAVDPAFLQVVSLQINALLEQIMKPPATGPGRPDRYDHRPEYA